MPHPHPVPAPWLPAWFRCPTRCELVTGHHLRPLRAGDAAVPGLPPWVEVDGALARASARAGFVYLVFDDLEQHVLGVVELGPGDAPYDARACWWLGQGAGSLVVALPAALTTWLGRAWPLREPLVRAR